MKSIIYQTAYRVIAERRNNSTMIAERKLDNLRKYKDFNDNYVQIYEQTARCGKALYQNANYAEEKQKLDALKKEQLQLLTKYGMTSEDLVPHFYCTKCNDTGYTNGDKCECYKAEIRRLTLNDSYTIMPNANFSSSTVQDKNYDFAKKYSAKYPDVKRYSILLSGQTGTGKTYLCSCIANELISRNIPTVMISAFQLNNIFVTDMRADIDDKGMYVDNLIDVDVLIIDDLGTEQIYRNVTAEYLLNIINERNNMHKATIISTNLDLAQIKLRYGERIFSRIMDKEIFYKIEIVGDDKRLK